MEALMLRGSMDQPISPYKSQIRNPRNIHHQYPHTIGLLQAPPPPFLSHSYPPYSLQQPPLLPLPVTNHRRAGKKPNSVGNRTRDAPLTPKKSKSPRKAPAKPSIGSPKTGQSGPGPKELPKSNNKPFVSSPGNLLDSAKTCVVTDSLSSVGNNQVDLFSGSAAFTISPPPSSLPLPTFSLRPKLISSCRAEVAAGVDAGATDDLLRLLRIR